MPFTVVLENSQGHQATWEFPTDREVSVEVTPCGRNTWRRKTLSQLEAGDHVSFPPPGGGAHCSQVVSVTES